VYKKTKKIAYVKLLVAADYVAPRGYKFCNYAHWFHMKDVRTIEVVI
jgi:hypothetical protein